MKTLNELFAIAEQMRKQFRKVKLETVTFEPGRTLVFTKTPWKASTGNPGTKAYRVAYGKTPRAAMHHLMEQLK